MGRLREGIAVWDVGHYPDPVNCTETLELLNLFTAGHVHIALSPISIVSLAVALIGVLNQRDSLGSSGSKMLGKSKLTAFFLVMWVVGWAIVLVLKF